MCMDYNPVWLKNEPKQKPIKKVRHHSNEKVVKMRPKSRIMDVNGVFQEFADGTSMHGVPRIINARSVTARIFWTLICLGAFIMFFWQCGILLQRFYSYPKKVNVEILQQPVPFPAVSVCNVDHMDFEMANRLSELLKNNYGPAPEAADYSSEYGMSFNESEMPNYDDYGAYGGDYGDYVYQMPTYDYGSDFTNSYMQFVDNALLFMRVYESSYGDTNFMEVITESLSRLGLPANLGINVTSDGGVRLKDFIINCRFMDDMCGISESFKRIFDPYFFNCFTFSPEHILPSRSMRLRGVDYGLSLLLFTGSAGQVRKYDILDYSEDQNETAFFMPGTEESDSALASGRGARVVVHSPDTRPNPTAVGYDIPPGFSVTIGVKARKNVRIAGNHGNCTDNGTDSSFKYTLISCQNSCIQREIMSKCRCVDSRLSLPAETENLPFCFKLPEDMLTHCDRFSLRNFSVECKLAIDNWKKTIECRGQVYDDMTINKPEAMEMCKCYPPCEDIVYDSSYSLSTLPDNPKEQTTFILKINRYVDELEDSRKKVLTQKFGTQRIEHGIMGHLSRLNVHIADNNIMKTTESPDYEPIRLVSDIGGQLGLWIGISVMTLFEVLQLIADVFRYLTGKGRNIGEKKVSAPNTICGNNRTYGNGDRFRIPESDIELPCEIDKLTTV